MSTAAPRPGDSSPPPGLDRRVEAIVCRWDREAAARWTDPVAVRRLAAQACELAVEVAILGDARLGELVRWLGPCWSSSACPPLVADSSAQLERELWCAGIAPEQVAAVTTDALPAVLADQVDRRRRGEPPRFAGDPAWTLTIDGIDQRLERVHESLLTLADGRLGTRGSVLTGSAQGMPSVLLAGIYAGSGAESHLLAGPPWNHLALREAPPLAPQRILDLHNGTLSQQLTGENVRLDAVALSSLARPATALLRVHGCGSPPPLREDPGTPPHDDAAAADPDGCRTLRVTDPPASIVAALHEDVRAVDAAEPARAWTLDRIACYAGTNDGEPDERAARGRLRAARALGFERLFGEHRRAWAARWEDADIAIDGDDDLRLRVRLALFHLMASVADSGEAAVGARGLTGPAYRGHVFWDTDVYVLPFHAATHPRAARAMLEYRLARLPAALRAAREQGRAGARFAWESAATGDDVTPRAMRDRRGRFVAVRTGDLEQHIVADVAWAACHYADWTGDRAFATGPGRTLLVQAARWWAARIDVEGDGAHIRGVIGPDEYHVDVDDDAYTNVMARWTLRRAAAAASAVLDEAERRRWLQLADMLVDNHDRASGVYEQFAGFAGLEPLVIADIAPQRPVAADLLLGAERTRAAQIVKQPDVLMLHYLVPAEVAPGSLAANLGFYEPRTAHGSSLSPGIHAALMARAGRLADALELLRLTARIDLDDIGQTTGGGLHLAAMGSVWGAIAFGFAGLRADGDRLLVDPRPMPGLDAFELRVRFRGSRVRLRVTADDAAISAEPPVAVVTADGDSFQVARAPQRLGVPAMTAGEMP